MWGGRRRRRTEDASCSRSELRTGAGLWGVIYIYSSLSNKAGRRLAVCVAGFFYYVLLLWSALTHKTQRCLFLFLLWLSSAVIKQRKQRLISFFLLLISMHQLARFLSSDNSYSLLVWPSRFTVYCHSVWWEKKTFMAQILVVQWHTWIVSR